MTKFSVIIPTFNRERFVVKAIDSVLKQTCRDYEIIVVDDGSTDNTRSVLEPYDQSIRYLFQVNSGVSAARNAGMQVASGEWIAFLDSDDEWTMGYLAAQQAQLERYPDAIAHLVNAVTIFPDGRRSVHFDEIAFSAEFNGKPSIYVAWPFKTIVEHTHWFIQSAIIRHDALLETGFFDPALTIAEDMDLFSRVAARGPFTFTRRVLVEIYRRQEEIECLSSQHVKRGLYSARAFCSVYGKMLELKGLSKAERRAVGRALSSHWLALGNLLIRVGRRRDARHFYLKAFRLGHALRSLVKYLLGFLPKEVSIRLMRKGLDIIPGEDVAN